MDFEEGFVTAKLMKYTDFKEEGSENAIKALESTDNRAEIILLEMVTSAH